MAAVRFQTQVLKVLEHLVAGSDHRGGPPCRLRRWHLSGPQRRRLDRLHPRACDRLASARVRRTRGHGLPSWARYPRRMSWSAMAARDSRKRARGYGRQPASNAAPSMLFAKSGRRRRTRPKLQAGVELYGLAKELLAIKEVASALAWLEAYSAWCSRWEGFLAERTLDEESGRMRWTHERLVTARNSLNRLVSKNLLFTFLDPELTCDGPIPSMNNKIEGGINAQLRRMLRDHRGLSLMRRAKAIFWWCYVHTEVPLPAAEILKTMPTDDDIEELYRQVSTESQRTDGPKEWRWASLGRTQACSPMARRMGLAINTFCPITQHSYKKKKGFRAVG